MYLKYSHHIKECSSSCVFYYYLDVICLPDSVFFFHTCASVSLRLFSAKFSTCFLYIRITYLYLHLIHILYRQIFRLLYICFVHTCTSVSLRHFSAELSLISWTSSLYCRVRADMAVLWALAISLILFFIDSIAMLLSRSSDFFTFSISLLSWQDKDMDIINLN